MGVRVGVRVRVRVRVKPTPNPDPKPKPASLTLELRERAATDPPQPRLPKTVRVAIWGDRTIRYRTVYGWSYRRPYGAVATPPPPRVFFQEWVRVFTPYDAAHQQADRAHPNPTPKPTPTPNPKP